MTTSETTVPAASTATSPWTSGPLAPVSEELTAFDLPVTGTIPEQLQGRLLRNGPNPIGVVDPMTHHWFTGEGMVHGIRLRDGRAEWYRNRWVRSPEVADVLGEPHRPSAYPESTRLFAANTNVIVHAGRTFALVEAGTPPVELSDDLDTIGATDFGGTLEHPFTAHPKLDPATGNLHAVAYYWGWGNKVRYMVVGPDARVTHSADIDLPAQPMMHDLSITETRVVLFDLPCTFNIDVAMAGARLPYRWDSSYQARLGVLPLGGTAADVTWIDIDPCYVFHPANAYDDGDRIVLDVVRWDSMFNTELNGPNEGLSRLDRWVVDPTAGTVTATTVDDRGQEFPRVDERLVGRPHRYIYGCEFGPGAVPGAALRHDVVSGVTERHDYGPGRTTGELVFVPNGDTAAEDDGWLMSCVDDATTGRSDLVILDAADFLGDPVATVHLPGRVPLGFHGNWAPDHT
jgi:carotenoid cleavage dioxygenase-like enzyme